MEAQIVKWIVILIYLFSGIPMKKHEAQTWIYEFKPIEMKTRIFDVKKGWYLIYCPACKSDHIFAVDTPFSNGKQWKFDGNIQNPTFTPSMNISWGPGETDEIPEGRCHFTITQGKVTYHDDCTHEYKGRVIDLPNLKD